MNVLSVLQAAVAQGLIWSVMVLGAYITYKILDFADLSVDGTFALGAALSITMTARGGNPVFSLLLAVVGGMLGGLCTALLATKLKIPGLLSGILTMLSMYSINLMIMGTSNVNIMNQDSLIDLIKMVLPIRQDIAAILVGLVAALALIAFLYWFFGTEIGCALRASGNNLNMARALGVNTDRMIIFGLMLSNGLVALSGALWSQYQGWADVGMGTGTMVTGLASIMIGQVVFGFLRRNFALKMLTAVLGSVAYWLIVTLVLQLGLGANNLKLFTAVLVAIALALPLMRGRLRKPAAAKNGAKEGE